MDDTMTGSRTADGAEPARAADEAGRHDVSLRLEGITKIFGDGSEVVAVDDVSLDIYRGEFIVLVGPSGCGKTTTLRTIAGLESPTEGRILIDGEDVSGREPRERDVAMVFQNYALYPHKTVRQNIAFPLEIRKYPDDVIATSVEETTELLGIQDLLDRRPADLSGGQQQRVALGRAIVRDPELFLFDEPLSNLDAKLRIQMRTELNKLHDRVGKTSVYVTHDQAEAMTLGDRVAVMNDGRIQQIDSPQVVYDEPANRFVAGFIGEPPMNFFDVRLEERGGAVRIVSESFELELPEAVAASLSSWDGDTDDLELGVRPEDFEVAALVDGPVPGEHVIEARVMVVEPMGSHKDLALRPVGQAGEAAVEFTARVSTDSTAIAGDEIAVKVDMDNVHLFDRRTGENLLV